MFVAFFILAKFTFLTRFYGAVVSTLDFESSNLGSNPGRTFDPSISTLTRHFVHALPTFYLALGSTFGS